MRSHIDWLTFTMTMPYDTEGVTTYDAAVEAAFMTTFGAKLVREAFGGIWGKNERSRAPYVDAWGIKEGAITLFASNTLSHCCVEISGAGCERLLKMQLLDAVLARCCQRVTRIDIACDIETTVKPTEFVEKTNHERMRASGYQKSETGETCYVGSQKSDRYARVYRYAEPHPRSKLLRIEHVFRREYAKIVSQRVVESGINAVARAAGDAFGWAHPVWNAADGEDCDISVVAAERKMGKTVFWLVKSVAPAFKRLVQDGTIRDPEAFVREYFGVG